MLTAVLAEVTSGAIPKGLKTALGQEVPAHMYTLPRIWAKVHSFKSVMTYDNITDHYSSIGWENGSQAVFSVFWHDATLSDLFLHLNQIENTPCQATPGLGVLQQGI